MSVTEALTIIAALVRKHGSDDCKDAYNFIWARLTDDILFDIDLVQKDKRNAKNGVKVLKDV